MQTLKQMIYINNDKSTKLRAKFLNNIKIEMFKQLK